MLIRARSRVENTARAFFLGSHLFMPLREAYQLCFNREKLAFRRRMRAFYSAFVRTGDVVFDIGANVGAYSEVFCALGARVVAVEPNPKCQRVLELMARTRRIHIQRCAAGDIPGRMPLHLCEEHGLSTVWDEWQETVRNSPLHCNAKWTGDIEVEVLTLDQLAVKYGVPSFVKIDVEGFDDRVLRGMSFRPNAVTFEFNKNMPGVCLRCLDAPAMSEGYQFNFVRAFEMQFASANWMSKEELGQKLSILAADEEYGDVVAKREEVLVDRNGVSSK